VRQTRQKHSAAFKAKVALTAEQHRCDVAEARHAFIRHRPALEMERLMFLDETAMAVLTAGRNAGTGQRAKRGILDPHSRSSSL
jgi:hypothetical protein